MKRIKQFLFITFFVFCVGLVSVEIYAQTARNQSVTRLAERHSGDKFTVFAKTRKGANVYGVKPISTAMLNAIDKGLDDLFEIARKHNYRARLNHSYYTIYIARPDRLKDRDGNYSPAFTISAPQYSGSVYDAGGGSIYVAGLVFYMNPDSFLIVDYDKNLNSISEIVRYEGEHIILYHNDRALYNETGDHSRSGGHPILN